MDLGFDGERILRERMDLGIRVHLFNLGEIKNLVMDKIMDKIWLMINFGCVFGRFSVFRPIFGFSADFWVFGRFFEFSVYFMICYLI